MTYEVEQKFRVANFFSLKKKLAAIGAVPIDEVEQVDTYFAHPSRDFGETDEALRMRQVGGANFLTYKGPKLDTTTKTRREIEFPIAAGSQGRQRGGELLEALGFTRVSNVVKRRQTYQLLRNGHAIEIALDNVAGLGNFVELEAAADCAKATELAKQILAKLATELGLEQSERRSYLEMLLEP